MTLTILPLSDLEALNREYENLMRVHTNRRNRAQVSIERNQSTGNVKAVTEAEQRLREAERALGEAQRGQGAVRDEIVRRRVPAPVRVKKE